MVHAALAISMLSGVVTVQESSGDAGALLDLAAEAMQAMSTVSYEADLEMRSATGRRVVSGTVTLAKLIAIAPEGTVDPTSGIYNSTMYLMAALLLVGLISNALMRPVDPSHHLREDSASD